MSSIKALTQAVLDTINDLNPEGAPAGPLYAALMEGIGIDYTTFALYMTSLERLSLLSQRGHRYYITPKGQQWLTTYNTELPTCPAV